MLDLTSHLLRRPDPCYLTMDTGGGITTHFPLDGECSLLHPLRDRGAGHVMLMKDDMVRRVHACTKAMGLAHHKDLFGTLVMAFLPMTVQLDRICAAILELNISR